MRNLNTREGLDDLDQVLLQHRVVQSAQVRCDEAVPAQLDSVRVQRILILLQAAVRVRAGHGFHRVQVLAGVFEGVLGSHERVDVVAEVQHDLAQQHVLQGRGGLESLVLRSVALHGLDEVRKGRVEVAVLGVQLAGLHVQVGLQERRAVDARGAGAGGGQGGAAFGHVAEGVVDFALEQLDFDEHELVVQPFELLEQVVDECEGIIVCLLLHVQADESHLEVLAQEALAL